MKLYLISGECTDIGIQEVKAITNNNVQYEKNRILISKSKRDLTNRLAYTHCVLEFMFKCKINELNDIIKKNNFEKHYSISYRVKKIHVDSKTNISERNLAEKIWHTLKKPKINLNKPKTEFIFIFQNDMVYCGKLIKNIDKDVLDRKPHMKPFHVPISLHPRLAKAIINLSGINKGKICDPFCGTGGILIEAGLMGLNPVGYDISKKMIMFSEKNLKHYKINNSTVIEKDALTMGKFDYVITDLPYGKNTKSFDPKILFNGFLEQLKKKLRKRAVIVFHDGINAKQMIKKHGFKTIKKFDYYIHKSMSKEIFVIEP